MSLVDLGKPDNNAKNRSGPELARRAGHCVIARSSRLALPGAALPPFPEITFGNHSNVATSSHDSSGACP
jgi:hypothetical protein